MKIAFFGAGAIAKSHLDAFRIAGANIVGVCTRTESGKKFAGENGIPHWSASPTALLEKARPDAVCFLTQPSSYKELLAEIKPAGLPVFLEKPISYSVAEAEKLRPDLPKIVFVGQNRRFYSGVRQVREKLLNTKEMFVQLYLPERAKDYAHCDEITRNTWNFLNGIHGIDLLTYLAGSPKRIIAKEAWGKLEFTKLPRFHTSMYETDRGHRVSFMGGFDAAGGWRLHFFMRQEEIIFAPFEETRIRTLSGIETLQTSADDKNAKPGFVAQAKCFLEGASGNSLGSEWVSFDDALVSMSAIEKIYATL